MMKNHRLKSIFSLLKSKLSAHQIRYITEKANACHAYKLVVRRWPGAQDSASLKSAAVLETSQCWSWILATVKRSVKTSFTLTKKKNHAKMTTMKIFCPQALLTPVEQAEIVIKLNRSLAVNQQKA